VALKCLELNFKPKNYNKFYQEHRVKNEIFKICKEMNKVKKWIYILRVINLV